MNTSIKCVCIFGTEQLNSIVCNYVNDIHIVRINDIHIRTACTYVIYSNQMLTENTKVHINYNSDEMDKTCSTVRIAELWMSV